jgi:sialate O-acetylesterase
LLQRGKLVPVWGHAAPGERITVSFAGQSRSVSAAGGVGQRRRLGGCRRQYLTIHDVVVGEVWLCSGQSNMELTVKESRDAAREIASAHNALIRVIKIKHAVSVLPKETAAATGWQLASPQTAGAFTAVAGGGDSRGSV